MSTIGLVVVLIVIFLLGTILFVGGGTLIYYFIYRHTINKRVAQGITHKKGLMSPIWMALILLAVMLFLLMPILIIAAAGFLTFNLVGASGEEEIYENMEISCYTAQEMQEGHMSVFSIEENEGYTKQQAEGDGIRFTCFAAEELGQSWQPHYLLYTELSEDFPKNAVYVIEGTFYENGEATGGVSWYPTKKEFPSCIISGMPDIEDMDCTYEIEITCNVLDEKEEETLSSFSETFVLSAAE